MPFPFRQETRAVLRRRVGSLLYPSGFRSGTLSAATASSVTVAFAKRVATGALKGRVLHVTSGTGAGQAAAVTNNTIGTGVIDISPSFGVTPDATSVVELWPEELDPEQVNDALNLAVLDAAPMISVRVDLTSPTIDADRKIVTPPVTWVYLMDLLFKEDTGYWRRYIPTQFDGYWVPCEYEYTVLNGQMYLSYPVPTNITGANMLLRGYRLPAELTADSTLCEVHSDFVVYTAALHLDSGLTEGPALDPEAHGQRSAAWLRSALVARTKLGTDWESTIVKLRP